MSEREFRLALHWQILIGMTLGAIVGIVVNNTFGTAQRRVTAGLPEGIRELQVLDSPSHIEISLERTDGGREEFVVDPTSNDPDTFRSLEALENEFPQVEQLFQRYGRSRGRQIGEWCQRLGGLFLRLLQMVAVPLIVGSLTTGIMGLGAAGKIGPMFRRTILYYVCTSLLAIFTGLLAVNLVRPGLRVGANPPADAALETSASLPEVLFGQLEAMIPANPLGALVEPNFLSIIAFTIAFAIFALRVGGAVAQWVKTAAEMLFEVMMAMTIAIIALAPVGVFFLMAYVTATQGLSVFQSLAWYMLAVLLALSVHAMINLPLILRFVAKRNPLEFATAMSPALLTAFSTASSNGTLPVTLSNVERRGKVSNRVGSFVLPLGATVNMDGTALYEAVAVLFIAQLHHGANLPLSQQLIVAATALLASIGAAGIPHAGLVMMVIILQAVNLPVEMQGIILAVDRVLDMARTSVNVWSDSCGCAVVQSLEDRAA